MKRRNINIVLVPLLLFLAFGCIKEVGIADVKQQTFLKQYGTSDGDFFTFITKDDEEGYIAAGAFDASDGLRVLATNKHGSKKWDITVPSINELRLPQGTKLRDGSMVFSHFYYSSQVIKVDQSGNVLFNLEFDPSLWQGYTYSHPFEAPNGDIFIGMTDGWSQGSASKIWISCLDPSQGNEKFYYGYRDEEFGGKVGILRIYKIDGDQIWVIGELIRHNPWWSWGDPSKVFLAKLNRATVEKVNILTTDQDEQEEFVNAIAGTKDGGLILSTSTASWLFDIENVTTSIVLRRFDINQTLLWKKTITLENTTGFATSTIKEKASGEIVCSGWCEPNNSNGFKPFLIELNADGNVISSKIVNAGNSYAIDMIPDDDGYVFAGGINGFGKLFEKGDPLILKTDKNLEY